MINVYTCKNLIPEGYTEMFTDPIGVVRQFMKAKEFTDLEIDTLKEIDEATVYDKEWSLVKTPYGVTNIYNVSKGCQNVLAYIWVIKNNSKKKLWIDIGHCELKITKDAIEINPIGTAAAEWAETLPMGEDGKRIIPTF